jgi:hypothetical protein
LVGGSGQVGTMLARHFHSQGDSVEVLTGRPSPDAWRNEYWDGATMGKWPEELNGADILINLAGRSVNCR